MTEPTVGDRVCFSRKHLQSIFCVSGPYAHMEGVITEIKEYGKLKLAIVDDGNKKPLKVIIQNLIKVDEKHKEPV